MNKKDFKQYMRQGLGRCALELEASSDIQRYKETVLWGCLHNLSFDAQSEGTRAEYVYSLTKYFDDADYFVLPVVDAFLKLSPKEDWLFLHFCTLLCKFAENGSQIARDAINEKYGILLSALIKKKRFSIYDLERDNFECICIELLSLDGVGAVLKIITDIGCLFIENPHYSAEDFCYLCYSMEKKIGAKRFEGILMREAKRQDGAREFYKRYSEYVNASACERHVNSIPSAEDIKDELIKNKALSISSKVRFRRQSDEERIKLAMQVLSEEDVNLKAELLSVFAFEDESFPLDHKTIIEYSRSPNKKLRDTAFRVLFGAQSEYVRKYALELLESGEHKIGAIKMLISSYTKEDKDMLLDLLYSLDVDYEEKSDWHSIGLKILKKRKGKVRLPAELYLYVYNTTLCSCCRCDAVKALGHQRALTREIIEECRHDSNRDISSYVNRYYPEK